MAELSRFFDPKYFALDLWEPVFDHLDVAELKKLAMTCKTFNKMIGTLSSTMDRMILVINNETPKEDIDDCILQSSRKYNSIYLSSHHEEYQLRIFEKFGPNLKQLRMTYFNYSKSKYIRLFGFTPNLEFLKWDIGDIKEESQELIVPEKSKLTNLKTLSLHVSELHMSSFLDFVPDSIIEFELVPVFVSYEIPYDLTINFLQKLKNLKHLKLHLMDNENEYLDKFDSSKMKFQLESLEVHIFNGWYSSKNFNKFLKSQKCLKKLNLKSFVIDNALEHLLNLEELKVDFEYDFVFEEGKSRICPSLKKLSLHIDNRDIQMQLISKFNNLEEIDVITNIDAEFTEKIAEKNPNLKKLTISDFNDSVFQNVIFDRVVKLIINNSSTASIGKFYHIFASLPNLQKLELLEKTSLDSQTLAWLLINFKSLTHLTVKDGSKLESQSTCLINISNMQIFRNLKYLQINSFKDTTNEFLKSLKQFRDLKCLITEEGA